MGMEGWGRKIMQWVVMGDTDIMLPPSVFNEIFLYCLTNVKHYIHFNIKFSANGLTFRKMSRTCTTIVNIPHTLQYISSITATRGQLRYKYSFLPVQQFQWWIKLRLRLRLRQSLFNINRYIDTSIISGLHAIDRNTNNIVPLINYEI